MPEIVPQSPRTNSPSFSGKEIRGQAGRNRVQRKGRAMLPPMTRWKGREGMVVAGRAAKRVLEQVEAPLGGSSAAQCLCSSVPVRAKSKIFEIGDEDAHEK